MLIQTVLITCFALFVLTVLQIKFNKRANSEECFYPSAFLWISAKLQTDKILCSLNFQLKYECESEVLRAVWKTIFCAGSLLQAVRCSESWAVQAGWSGVGIAAVCLQQQGWHRATRLALVLQFTWLGLQDWNFESISFGLRIESVTLAIPCHICSSAFPICGLRVGFFLYYI